MGLDMYLHCEVYIGGNYKEFNKKYKFPKGYNKNDDRGEYVFDLKDISSISLQVGYWRKSNQIHNWFVKECGEGIDNCQRIYVTDEKLEELRDICKKVIQDKSLAKELLPCSPGFFFGSTKYDEWYFSDLEDTVKIIDKALKKVKDLCGDFYYKASW